MKQLILSLAILASCSLISSAQSSFTTQYPDSSTGWYIGQSTDFNVNNYIKNITNDYIYIKWRITASYIGSGWKFKGFCDNFLCYSETSSGLLDGSEARVSSAYVPNEFGDFHALFNGADALNNSTAWIEVVAEDTVNNDVKTLRFIARKGPLGIINVTSATEMTFYPNPAQNHININWAPTIPVGGIQILSTTGQLISSFTTTGSNMRLDLAHLPPGLYYARVIDEYEHVISTHKFSHY